MGALLFTMPVTKVIDVDGDRLEVSYTPEHKCVLMLSKSDDPYMHHTIELDADDVAALVSMLRECQRWMKSDGV